MKGTKGDKHRHETVGLFAGLAGRACVKKLGNRGDNMGRCERLSEQDAVRDALGRPFFGVGAGHVDNGHFGFDFSSSAADIPFVKFSG
jgi:hypothetical protein